MKYFLLCAIAVGHLMAVPNVLEAGSDKLRLAVGQNAPPFRLRDMQSEDFVLNDIVGKNVAQPKTLVLVFFATWCGPCKREIPIMRDIYKRWKSSGVEVVYVGLRESAKSLKPFLEEVPLEMRVLPDRFGLRGACIP